MRMVEQLAHRDTGQPLHRSPAKTCEDVLERIGPGDATGGHRLFHEHPGQHLRQATRDDLAGLVPDDDLLIVDPCGHPRPGETLAFRHRIQARAERVPVPQQGSDAGQPTIVGRSCINRHRSS
ncbi:hypothetical protein XFF6970_220006 [Xanthomonas citri pv. fuscans]|nr:hypothetical protein XFF6970_220006 [Xanthomonas citri pv. fuscans]